MSPGTSFQLALGSGGSLRSDTRHILQIFSFMTYLGCAHNLFENPPNRCADGGFGDGNKQVVIENASQNCEFLFSRRYCTALLLEIAFDQQHTR